MPALYLKMRVYFGKVSFVLVCVPYKIGEKIYIQFKEDELADKFMPFSCLLCS